MKITKTQQVTPSAILLHSPNSLPALESLKAGNVQRIDITIEEHNETANILKQLLESIVEDKLSSLAGIPMNINIHFGSNQEALAAFSKLYNSIPPGALESKPQSYVLPAQLPTSITPTTNTQMFTIGQSAKGGAVIGGISGAGIGVLLNTFKSTAELTNDPILSTIGTVLCGIGAGALSGAVVHKANEFTIDLTPESLRLYAGNQPPIKDSKE